MCLPIAHAQKACQLESCGLLVGNEVVLVEGFADFAPQIARGIELLEHSRCCQREGNSLVRASKGMTRNLLAAGAKESIVNQPEPALTARRAAAGDGSRNID
jgi:hypothetical protein